MSQMSDAFSEGANARGPVAARIVETITRLLTPWRTTAYRATAFHLHGRVLPMLAEAGILATDTDVDAALRLMLDDGTLEHVSGRYQLAPVALVRTREADDALTGCTVTVNTVQSSLGPAKYPGRTGTALYQNSCGKTTGGLWYVRLNPTNRAAERVEAFWTRDLTVVEKCSSL